MPGRCKIYDQQESFWEKDARSSPNLRSAGNIQEERCPVEAEFTISGNHSGRKMLGRRKIHDQRESFWKKDTRTVFESKEIVILSGDFSAFPKRILLKGDSFPLPQIQ